MTCGLALTGVAGKVMGKDPKRHWGSRQGRHGPAQSAGWAVKLRPACCGGSSHFSVLVSLQGACRSPCSAPLWPPLSVSLHPEQQNQKESLYEELVCCEGGLGKASMQRAGCSSL